MQANGLKMRHGVGALCLFLSVALGAAADQKVYEEMTLDSGGKVHVDNVKGSIEVTGWNESKVVLEGTIGSRVEGIEIEKDDDEVSFEVKYPRDGARRAGESRLKLRVPHGASLELEGVSCQIKVFNVHGEIDVESVSGSVEIQSDSPEIRAESVSGTVKVYGEAGAVYAESVSGSVEVVGARESVRAESVSGTIKINGPASRIEAETVSGSIRLTDVRGEVDAESVSGTVDVDGGDFNDCRLVSCSGSIHWNGDLNDGGDMELDTHSGQVTMKFNSSPSADVRMESFSGSLNADLPGAGKFSGRKHLRFTVGDGDGEIKAHTFSGSIRIEGR